MKQVIVQELPECDLGHCPREARYNTPTRPDSVGQGRWANLCNEHNAAIGVMTSVTEHFKTEEEVNR